MDEPPLRIYFWVTVTLGVVVLGLWKLVELIENIGFLEFFIGLVIFTFGVLFYWLWNLIGGKNVD